MRRLNDPRVSLAISALLGLAVLSLLAVLSQRHEWRADWTANARNTLTPASQRLLDSLEGPVTATAWVFPDADLQREIRARFAPYLRAKSDFALHIVDPATAPQQVRALAISASGEVVLDYQGRREHLNTLTEASISAALQRLSYAGRAHVVFISGHGERDPQADEPHGYSGLAAALTERGIQLSRLPLATQAIPRDADLLVLAAPQSALLPGEIQRLVAHVEAGGNLLWLTDPELPEQPGLAEALGVRLLDGAILYRDHELLGTGHPALTLVASYPDHPVSQDFTDLTAFALTGGIEAGASWRPLLSSIERSWLHTGALEETARYDPGTDRPGPVLFGVSRQAPRADRPDPQRLVVLADSDFLTNAYLGQLGNRAFGLRLFQWLVHRDAQIVIEVPLAPDRQLQLAPMHTQLLALGFILVLPVLLILAGTLRWALRRRRRR